MKLQRLLSLTRQAADAYHMIETKTIVLLLESPAAKTA